MRRCAGRAFSFAIRLFPLNRGGRGVGLLHDRIAAQASIGHVRRGRVTGDEFVVAAASFGPATEMFLALAGLQQRRGLPGRLLVFGVAASVLAERGFVVALMEVGFRREEPRHRGRFRVARLGIGQDASVRGAGFLQFGPSGMGPSGEEFEFVVGLLLATSRVDRSQGIGPTAGFAQGFDAAKSGRGEPGLLLGVGRLQECGESVGGIVPTAGLKGDFRRPEAGLLREFVLRELRRQFAAEQLPQRRLVAWSAPCGLAEAARAGASRRRRGRGVAQPLGGLRRAILGEVVLGQAIEGVGS